MIQIPEDGWGFGPASDDPGTLLSGRPAPMNDGYLFIPADGWGMVQPTPDDDPVTRADDMKVKAQRALDLMQTTTAANRELDTLVTGIVDGPGWREGLSRFDKAVAELRQKHLPRLKGMDAEDAFGRDLDEFAGMRRIGLKRALVEKQQGEALSALDDTLDYYAGEAAAAGHDVFREIAVDRGLKAIQAMREAGYLFPESASKLEAAFRGRIEGADLERIVQADPENALSVLNDARLFPNAAGDLRARLTEALALRPAIARSDDPPAEVRMADYRLERDGVAEIPLSDVGRQSEGPESAPTPTEGVSSTESANESRATPAPGKPDVWRQLTIQLHNSQQAARQGLHPQDLDSAKPLPDDLAKYNPEPGDSEDTIRTLYKQAYTAAEKQGIEIAFRFDPRTGEPQFVLRPESSLQVMEGDGFGASLINRVAEIADGFGRQLGLANLNPLGTIAAVGNRAANAFKTGRAFDEAALSSGGAGPTKGAGGSKAVYTAKPESEIRAAETEWAKKGVTIGDFGPVFEDLRGNWKDGVQRLLKEQTGEVPVALHHPQIGGIDLVWGRAGTAASDGYGLAKIATYHPEVLDDLWNTVAKMRVISRDSNRVRLESPDHMAVVSLEFHGAKKKWLLTAYQRDGSAISSP